MQGTDLFIMGAEPVTVQEILLGTGAFKCFFQVKDFFFQILDLLQGMLVIAGHGVI